MNFFLIKRFMGTSSDETLLHLIPFLIELASFEDVRDVKAKYKAYLKNPKKFYFSTKVINNNDFSRKDKDRRRLVRDGEEYVLSFRVNRAKILEARSRFQQIASTEIERSHPFLSK